MPVQIHQTPRGVLRYPRKDKHRMKRFVSLIFLLLCIMPLLYSILQSKSAIQSDSNGENILHIIMVFSNYLTL